MASPSFLIDGSAPIVLDTSAVININSTGSATPIFEALPCGVAVTDVLMRELEAGRRNGRSDLHEVEQHVRLGLIDIVGLGGRSEQHFETLVVGSAAETLDDGEAATIAHALAYGAIAVLDERKACGICATRFPALRIAGTLDLLLQPGVAQALGQDGLRHAVLNALQRARMSVPSRLQTWVVGLIGREAALTCPSLPRRLREAPAK